MRHAPALVVQLSQNIFRALQARWQHCKSPRIIGPVLGLIDRCAIRKQVMNGAVFCHAQSNSR
eukprot:8407747-Lingulodinium_polyedra.AAC.1